jgi:peptide/nickel transport system permease protein
MKLKIETNKDVQSTSIKTKPSSLWRVNLRKILSRKQSIIGGSIILLFIVLAVIAPLITLGDTNIQNSDNRLQAPSLTSGHILGTDHLGRDIYTRIIYGTRISLWIGFAAVAGALTLGTVLGLVAGFFRGWIDNVISRIFDIMLAFPSILLAIAIVAILGPGLVNALIAISIINIPHFGRLIRSRVLSLSEDDYVLASRAIGCSESRILFRHILPNGINPIIVQATLGIATAVIEAAALGFLGLGAERPSPEWGLMLADARSYMRIAPWTAIFPGIAIMLMVLGFNLLGDGVRDALDPKMKA